MGATGWDSSRPTLARAEVYAVIARMEREHALGRSPLYAIDGYVNHVV